MLLAIDVGNTNLAIGLYDGESLISDWRLATDRYRTADEWGMLLRSLLHLDSRDHERLGGIAISCVVPPLESMLERACRRYFGITPLFITNRADLGMVIRYENPNEVGADRIVNAVAAIRRYGAPAIIIDFGTATTFDVVNPEGEYCGGVICPGIGISANALFEKAAKLPRIDLVRPDRVVGSNTQASMQAGLYFGYLEQIKGIIVRIDEETGRRHRVVLTGGLATVFAEDLGSDVILDRSLTLEGIRLIYLRNRA